LSLSCLLSYILFSCHSFLSLQQKLQGTKDSAKNNPKGNAKTASELWVKKKAKNDALVAQGIGIDAALRPDAIKTIALMVVVPTIQRSIILP